MNPLSKRAEELYEEAYELADVLQKQGESDAERRYREIVAELLLHILRGVNLLRTVTFALLGFFGGVLFSRLLDAILAAL